MFSIVLSRRLGATASSWRTRVLKEGCPPKESLAAFADTYEPAMFEATPTAYAVKLTSSQESRMPPGLLARMIHLPGVEQEISGPTLPPKSATPSESAPGSPSEVVETDMFAFLDARTGGHLATVYVGPRQ